MTFVEALGGQNGDTIIEALGGEKGNTLDEVMAVKEIEVHDKETPVVVKYTVSYNANGGTGTIDSVEVTAGESITLSDGTGFTAPEGKEFAGWAKSSIAQSPTVESPFTPENDTTLYAVWTDATEEVVEPNDGE